MRFDMIALQEVASLLSIHYIQQYKSAYSIEPHAALLYIWQYKPAYSTATIQHCKPHVSTCSHQSVACAVYALLSETITVAHRHTTPLLSAPLLLPDCTAAHCCRGSTNVRIRYSATTHGLQWRKQLHREAWRTFGTFCLELRFQWALAGVDALCCRCIRLRQAASTDSQ